MPRSAGNTRLKAARLAAGLGSQQALADVLGVGVRQVRRWESENPPHPHPEVGKALTRLLGLDLEDLGFPTSSGALLERARSSTGAPSLAPAGLPGVSRHRAGVQPAHVAGDFLAVTRAHRRLYWSVTPAALHPAVQAHAGLGGVLLAETTGRTHREVAAALAESYLLAGRIEFFDIREPEPAGRTFLLALQAAGEAEDTLLGAAILAHAAFIPGWAGERDAALERMVAARTYARRGPAPLELLAWLDAVEAECETRCGNARAALRLLGHAEDLLAGESEHPVPPWLDWFSPVRLAAFKGNTQVKAGHLPQARQTLLEVLEALGPGAEKQVTVVLGDLAAVEAAAGDPQAACRYALRALDELERTWYATGMDRVRDVRRALTPYQDQPCVQELDDRLYGWSTTLSALTR